VLEVVARAFHLAREKKKIKNTKKKSLLHISSHNETEDVGIWPRLLSFYLPTLKRAV